MKSTGVIKKMDDLGRIVIPKEMRKMLNASINEVFELFVEDDSLILKRHNCFENVFNQLSKIINLIKDNKVCDCIVTDNEKVIFNTLNIECKISDICKNYILNREESVTDCKNLIENCIINKQVCFLPLFTELKAVGGLICIFDNDINEYNINIGRFIASIIKSIINDFY